MRADASFAVPVKLWALLCVFAGVTIGGNVLLTCILTGGALLYLVLQRNFRLAASYGCFYLLLALLLALGCTGCGEKLFYLTARNTTQSAAEDAIARLRAFDSKLALRSVTLTAKEKVCLHPDAEGCLLYTSPSPRDS